MRILVGCQSWSPGAYPLEVVRGLVSRGHEVSVLHGFGVAPAPPGVALLRFESLADRQASQSERPALQALLARRPADVVLLLCDAALWVTRTLQRHAPLARRVEDASHLCPAGTKRYADGSPCTHAAGQACMQRHLMQGGCEGLERGPGSSRSLLLDLQERLRELEAQRATDLWIVPSADLRHELIAGGSDPSRVAILAPPTRAPGRLAPFPLPEETEWFLGYSEGPLILCATELDLPHAGLDLVLDALTRVDLPFRMVIAGGGPKEHVFEGQARALGLSARVHFAGWLSPTQMAGLYPGCVMTILSTLDAQGAGSAVTEALVQGLPLVTFAEGAGLHLAADTCALRVPAEHPGALSNVIQALLADPERAQRIGAEGRRQIELSGADCDHAATLEALLLRTGASPRRPRGLRQAM